MADCRRTWLKRFATPLGPSLEGQELRTVIFVALSFQAVFTGYRSIQNLQSSLNEENGLGVISLGVLYGAWIFSGMLTPAALRFLTSKGAMMVAWVCHVLYTAATFYPAWELLLPASFLLGALSGPLWTAQSLYITACGYSRAKTAAESPYQIFSKFNGIFFAIYETSQITGNLVSSLVLQRGLGNGTEELLFKVCGPGDCPAADNATDIEEPAAWVTDVLLAVYVACSIVGFLITYVFVMPLPKSEWSIITSTRESVTSFFVTLLKTDILLLAPLFIFQGMQQAILFSEYTRSYVSCPMGMHMVGFVMAAHGATTPAVTWTFSRLVKLTGRYPLFVLAGLLNLLLMVVLHQWTPDDSDLGYIFLVPICWGVSEGIWLTQTNSLIAVRYTEQKEPAFSIYHTGRSVGLALTFAYSTFLCAQVKLVVGMFFVLAALLLYTLSELRFRRQQKRNTPTVSFTVQNGGAVRALAEGVHSITLNDLTQTSARTPRPASLHDLDVPGGRVHSDPALRASNHLTRVHTVPSQVSALSRTRSEPQATRAIVRALPKANSQRNTAAVPLSSLVLAARVSGDGLSPEVPPSPAQHKKKKDYGESIF